MKSEKNIVATMIKQHRLLQQDLEKTIEVADSAQKDGAHMIYVLLQKFKTDLNEHLELENNFFYKQLVGKMEKKNVDTTKIKEFISDMDDIGKAVYAFLDKYDDESVIGNNIKEFRKDVSEITQVLLVRIETEEAGVYLYWEMY